MRTSNLELIYLKCGHLTTNQEAAPTLQKKVQKFRSDTIKIIVIIKCPKGYFTDINDMKISFALI